MSRTTVEFLRERRELHERLCRSSRIAARHSQPVARVDEPIAFQLERTPRHLQRPSRNFERHTRSDPRASRHTKACRAHLGWLADRSGRSSIESLVTPLQTSRTCLQSSRDGPRAERPALHDDRLSLDLETLSPNVRVTAGDFLRLARASSRLAPFDRTPSVKNERASRRFETRPRHDVRGPYRIETRPDGIELGAHHFLGFGHLFQASSHRSETRSR